MKNQHIAPLWPRNLRHPFLFYIFDRLRDVWRNLTEKKRFRCRNLPVTAKRILILRDRGLGDVLQISTIFEAIRHRYQAEKLDLMTSEPGMEILAHDQRIDQLMLSTELFSDLEREYDLFINLHIFDNSLDIKRVVKSLPDNRILGRTYRQTEEWLSYLAGGSWLRKYCRIADVPFQPRLPLEIRIAHDQQWERDFNLCCQNHLVKISSDDTLVAICLGGRDWVRNYSPAFIEKMLTSFERNYQVVLFGLTMDRPLDQQQEIQAMITRHPLVLDLTDKLNLRELLFVLQRANVVVSCDTGPIHMTIGVGTPLVALFGHTTGSQLLGQKFISDRHIILNPVYGCRGCGYRLRKECLKNQQAQCMDRFNLQDVTRAICLFTNKS